VNRLEWQQLADEKLRAGSALLAASEWASAYYLVGYAIECGLKSCVLARLGGAPELIFEDSMFSKKCWTHDLEALVLLAGLQTERSNSVQKVPALAANWAVVSGWNEESRYLIESKTDAQALYNAIVSPADGVMQWIKARW
jgi:hypothetical protein